jgi:hypothetical protein
MGEHVDGRKSGPRRKKDGYYEAADPMLSRRRRVTFKNYLREVGEGLLDEDLVETEGESPRDLDGDPAD